jgi:hypothetical protein
MHAPTKAQANGETKGEAPAVAGVPSPDSVLLEQLFALLQEKVTDAPPLARDNVLDIVRGVVKVEGNAQKAGLQLEDLTGYCHTLHEFIQKVGV